MSVATKKQAGTLSAALAVAAGSLPSATTMATITTMAPPAIVTAMPAISGSTVAAGIVAAGGLFFTAEEARADRPGNNTDGECSGPCGTPGTPGGGGSISTPPQCQLMTQGAVVSTSGTRLPVRPISTTLNFETLSIYSRTGSSVTGYQNITVPLDAERLDESCRERLCGDTRLSSMGLSCAPATVTIVPPVVQAPRPASTPRRTIIPAAPVVHQRMVDGLVAVCEADEVNGLLQSHEERGEFLLQMDNANANGYYGLTGSQATMFGTVLTAEQLAALTTDPRADEFVEKCNTQNGSPLYWMANIEPMPENTPIENIVLTGLCAEFGANGTTRDGVTFFTTGVCNNDDIVTAATDNMCVGKAFENATAQDLAPVPTDVLVEALAKSIVRDRTP